MGPRADPGERRLVLESRDSRQAALGVGLFVVGFSLLVQLDMQLPEALHWLLWVVPSLVAGALVNRWWAPLLVLLPAPFILGPVGVDCITEPRSGPETEDELFVSSCWLGAIFLVPLAMTAAILGAGVASRRLARRLRARRAAS